MIIGYLNNMWWEWYNGWNCESWYGGLYNIRVMDMGWKFCYNFLVLCNLFFF